VQVSSRGLNFWANLLFIGLYVVHKANLHLQMIALCCIAFVMQVLL